MTSPPGRKKSTRAARRGQSANPFRDERLRPSAALVGAHVALARALERHAVEVVDLDTYLADLLVRLMRAPRKRLKGVEIARELLINPSRTTRLVDRAEAAGLVSREPHPDDRRAQLIVLTTAGEDLALRFAPLLLETLDATIFDTFTSAELDTLVALLDRLRDAAVAVAERDQLQGGS